MEKQTYTQPELKKINCLNKPLVSVSMIAFNQEQYIEQAIESVLVQKTNFPFEIIIGDDVSTDRTVEICEAYQKIHPNIIRVIKNRVNLGMMGNHIRTFKQCKGKYIATLESDDYWIDEYKLQKQIDALESDERMTICFTGRKDFYENTNRFVDVPANKKQNCFTVKDFAQDTFFHTCTMVFRNPKTTEWADKLEGMPMSDRPMYLSLLNETGGYAYKLQDMSAVFRLNENSVFTPLVPLQRTIRAKDMYLKMKNLFPELGIYLNRHLNTFDYFILRSAFKNNDKTEVIRLIKEILSRPTKPTDLFLKAKTLLHYFFIAIK